MYTLGVYQMNRLMNIIRKHENYNYRGFVSICTANMHVIEIALEKAKKENMVLIVETTSNQVNQFGGYTKLTPIQFSKKIHQLVKRVGFNEENLILGADHCGPLPFKKFDQTKALSHAMDLMTLYIEAGFNKIHVDTTISCADDPIKGPSIETIINRGVNLITEMKRKFKDSSDVNFNDIVFVVGSDVPPAGGSLEDEISPTSVTDFEETMMLYKEKLDPNVFNQIVGVVVQPKVDFEHFKLVRFEKAVVQSLVKGLEKWPKLVFEAHSTDYQCKEDLRSMVDNHFKILKVGPALTFAYKKALLGLSHIESWAVEKENQSNLITTIEDALDENPEYWNAYIKQGDINHRILRTFSYFDRSRYVYFDPRVIDAIKKLKNNINQSAIPHTLIEQYFPFVKNTDCGSLFETIIEYHVNCVLEDYIYATKDHD